MRTQPHYFSDALDIFPYLDQGSFTLPLIVGISAGFPSPAADFIDVEIDLIKEIVKNPSSTFYGRVKGDSMTDIGIDNRDIMVIDKSLDAKDNNIVVCFLDGDFVVKRIHFEKDGYSLVAANDKYKPIKVTTEAEFSIWGVVISVIKFY